MYYLEFSTLSDLGNMQLTLHSTFPWSLQMVIEKRPQLARMRLITSPGSHSMVSFLPSQAQAVWYLDTERRRLHKSRGAGQGMGLYGHGIYIWHIKRNFLVSGDDCCSLVWFGLDCWWACKDTYDLTIYAHRILTIWLVA